MIPSRFGWPSSCRTVHGSVGQFTTVRVVLYRWCDAGIGGGGRGPGSISGAGGVPGDSVVAAGAVLSGFFPSCQGVVRYFWLSCIQGCWVLCVAFFPPLQCALGASCRCRLLGALLVSLCSVLSVRARGPALRLGVCLLGFPAVACAVAPIATIESLCNTSFILTVASHCNTF